MKPYFIDTVIQFGKYSGKTIEEILFIDYDYINWCLINLNHFYIDDESIEQIKKKYPSFIHTKDANNKREAKQKKAIDEAEDLAQAKFEEEQRQEEMKWIENNYDDILFDGDPSSYWNID